MTILIIVDLFLRFFFRDGMFRCRYNEGIAFGIALVNVEIIIFFFLILITLIILRSFKDMKVSFLKVNLPFLWLFGLMNLVERLVYGSICDHIHFDLVGISFNLADLGISLIIIIFSLAIIKEDAK